MTASRGELSYEAARDELLDVVRRLEAGGVTLEDSLALWERGEELAAICQRWLDGARARLQAAATDGAKIGGPDGGEAGSDGADVDEVGLPDDIDEVDSAGSGG